MTSQLSRRAAILTVATGLVRVLGATVVGTWARSASATSSMRVRSLSELNQAIEKAQPGDTIIMANGRWDSAQIRLHGEGTAELPITLTAQTLGQVILTGRSSLNVQGHHIVARGLVFKDGHAPNSEVIVIGDHRNGADSEHCRITECSILNFNPALKGTEGIWVNLNGRHHRVDHCHFEGKTDKGPTMAVLLDNMQSDQNQHRIDFNHFGPRPVLGENGGETIRVGTGAFSTQISGTRIENNLFEACDGEVEVISIKSWRNQVRGNLFLRCRGTLTFRQGQHNVAEHNVFLGDRVADTGGIRIISGDQTIRNNVLISLRGTEYFSAMSFMNGAPGRSVGTYAPVVRALVEDNTFIDVTAITVGVGASAELRQAPTDSVFQRNLIVDCAKDLFVQLSPVDGIVFRDNVISGGAQAPVNSGFKKREIPVPAGIDSWGMPALDPVAGVGSTLRMVPFNRAAVGPSRVGA